MINIKFLDLFSGIGCFRFGFEKAGFTCAGHCEINEYANKSYHAMHDVKEGEWFEKDITQVSSGSLPACTIWTGGFPSQDVSQAGPRTGLLGERSGLFFEIVRLLRGLDPEHRPRWVLLENVKSVLHITEGFDFTTILFELASVGYDCEWACTNSKDFGVPQNRERVYFVFRTGKRTSRKVFPVGFSNETTLKQIIGGPQGSRIYRTDGLSTTLCSGSGGLGGKTGLYMINIDKEKGVIFRENSNTIDASYGRGLGSHQKRTAVLHSELPRAFLTPNRLEKRQNGRRYKDEDEEMFTLTSSDRLT